MVAAVTTNAIIVPSPDFRAVTENRASPLLSNARTCAEFNENPRARRTERALKKTGRGGKGCSVPGKERRVAIYLRVSWRRRWKRRRRRRRRRNCSCSEALHIEHLVLFFSLHCTVSLSLSQREGVGQRGWAHWIMILEKQRRISGTRGTRKEGRQNLLGRIFNEQCSESARQPFSFSFFSFQVIILN